MKSKMMKTKQLLWTLSGIMMLGVIWLVLAMLGIRVRYVVMWFVLSIGPFLFWCSLLAIHLAMGWYVWRDARKRVDLLIGIPPWVWGLMGLTGGVL
jgi:hypothetical protein